MHKQIRGNKQQVKTIRENKESKRMKVNKDTEWWTNRKLENKKWQIGVPGTHEHLLAVHKQLASQIPSLRA